MRRLTLILLVILSSCTLFGKDDPLDLSLPDTVRIGCPIAACSMSAGDSIGVPIYLWNDEYVGAVSLAFTYDGELVEATSWSLSGSVIPPAVQSWSSVGFFPQENRFKFYWSDHTGFSNSIPSTQGSRGLLLGTVYFRALVTSPSGVIDIDSVSFPVGSRFSLAWQPISSFVPNYVDCGQSDLLLGSHSDLNGDGMSTLSDIMFLVDFLFRGGPAPQPAAFADVNCDGRVNLVDAVFLVQQILQ